MRNLARPRGKKGSACTGSPSAAKRHPGGGQPKPSTTSSGNYSSSPRWPPCHDPIDANNLPRNRSNIRIHSLVQTAATRWLAAGYGGAGSRSDRPYPATDEAPWPRRTRDNLGWSSDMQQLAHWFSSSRHSWSSQGERYARWWMPLRPDPRLRPSHPNQSHQCAC
ncbi:hypothetical protein D3C72_1698430 [compost metagenome]